MTVIQGNQKDKYQGYKNLQKSIVFNVTNVTKKHFIFRQNREKSRKYLLINQEKSGIYCYKTSTFFQAKS